LGAVFFQTGLKELLLTRPIKTGLNKYVLNKKEYVLFAKAILLINKINQHITLTNISHAWRLGKTPFSLINPFFFFFIKLIHVFFVSINGG
jgi:hypothetical protein